MTHSATFVALLCTTAASQSLARPWEPGPEGVIRWRSGAVDPTPDATESAVVRLARLAQEPARHVIVRFSEPVNDEQKIQLASSGLTLLRYLGENAFFAAIDPSRLARTPQAGLSTLADARSIEAGHKIAPGFAGVDVPRHAVVGVGALGEPRVGAYVVFHPDVSMEDAEALAAPYGNVRDTVSLVNALVIELPLSNVRLLAAEDSVQWIEPPLPRMTGICNDSNRTRIGADVANAAPYGLDGTGIDVLVYDGGTARATHQDFGGRVTVRDSSGMSDHATHVAGTIGGSGAASGGLRKGMAPGVTLESYGFEDDGTGFFLYSNPGDIQADYDEAVNVFGSDIANNSIGSNLEFYPPPEPCSFQGNYGVTDQLIDSIVRGGLGAPFRVVWADGNERGGDGCDVEGFGDFYSTAPPATAKNHITVGALNSNDDSMTTFSSWGPTDDGRMKPDLCSAGDQSDEDGGVTSCSWFSDTSYTVKSGTSMASPTVCGAAALLMQDFRDRYPGMPDPRNSTLKVLLAQTAVDLGNVGPDYQFGYGSVRIVPAIDLMRADHFTEKTVTQGNTVTYKVVVPSGTTQLKVTLAWDDFQGTPNVIPSKINDLDLKVFSPTNAQSFPWTLNPSNPSAAAVRTVRNSRDNIEQVLVDNPAVGTWSVQVFGFSVPQGPQAFSICASPNLDHALDVPSEFPTIQDAVNAASDGDVVQLAPLTYQGIGNRDIDFLGKAITLRGSGPSTCTIDAQLLGRGLKIEYVANPSGVRVEGVRIINGSSGDSNGDYGGGIYSLNSTLRVKNCIVENCKVTVYQGGGIYFYTGFNDNTLHTLDVENCIIRNNTANSITGGSGGGIHVATARGIEARIRNCFITGNTARVGGAGIYTSIQPLVQPENCIVDIDGCTIAANTNLSSSASGGGVFSAHLDNSTGLTWIRNSILWGNISANGAQLAIFDGICAMHYSDLQGGVPGIYIDPDGCGGPPCSGGGFFANGIGVIDIDPQFQNPPANYHLKKFSPCINAGSPNFVPLPGETDIDGGARVLEGRIEMGADERFFGAQQQPPP